MVQSGCFDQIMTQVLRLRWESKLEQPAEESAEGTVSRQGRGSGVGTIHGSRGTSFALAEAGFTCGNHTMRCLQRACFVRRQSAAGDVMLTMPDA